jgi:hypothetical protein
MNRQKGWSPLHAAAFNWWLGRRPIVFSPEEHLERPEINTKDDAEARLARAIADEYRRFRKLAAIKKQLRGEE